MRILVSDEMDAEAIGAWFAFALSAVAILVAQSTTTATTVDWIVLTYMHLRSTFGMTAWCCSKAVEPFARVAPRTLLLRLSANG